MIGWRIPLATICLLIGVSFSTDPNAWWRALGGVFLVFVPALVSDHVVDVIGRPARMHRAAMLNNVRPGYQGVPDDEMKMHSNDESDLTERDLNGG